MKERRESQRGRLESNGRVLGQQRGQTSAGGGGRRGLSRGPCNRGLVQLRGHGAPRELAAVFAVEKSARGPVRARQLRLLGQNRIQTFSFGRRLDAEQLQAEAVALFARLVPREVRLLMLMRNRLKVNA
jgi:hypothetical protein